MRSLAFAKPVDLSQTNTELCARIKAWTRSGGPMSGPAWHDANAAAWALDDNLADAIDAEIERLRELEEENDHV